MSVKQCKKTCAKNLLKDFVNNQFNGVKLLKNDFFFHKLARPAGVLKRALIGNCLYNSVEKVWLSLNV